MTAFNTVRVLLTMTAASDVTAADVARGIEDWANDAPGFPYDAWRLDSDTFDGVDARALRHDDRVINAGDARALDDLREECQALGVGAHPHPLIERVRSDRTVDDALALSVARQALERFVRAIDDQSSTGVVEAVYAARRALEVLPGQKENNR